jgi:UDP-3-O-[3-hydroxymyristoyl] glucosamine N-acyltransferase
VQLRLGSIVEALGGDLHGDGERMIDGLAPLESATPSQLTFATGAKYRAPLAASRAGCVIVGPDLREAALARGDAIVADQPYLYFARVTQLWKRGADARPQPAVHPSAVVDPGAVIDPTARIGALCIVERGARIGAGSVLKARVTVGEDCVIGARCTLPPGAVIGADGFGFAPDGERWEKVEQLGAVRIGDDVEIGANTCIDRGALQDTVIEQGAKLDNLIQCGNN